jgi:hypothetical protein
VTAINQAPVFEIAEGEPDRNTADLETAAKLVLTRDRERAGIGVLQDLAGQDRNEVGTGSGRTRQTHQLLLEMIPGRSIKIQTRE